MNTATFVLVPSNVFTSILLQWVNISWVTKSKTYNNDFSMLCGVTAQKIQQSQVKLSQEGGNLSHFSRTIKQVTSKEPRLPQKILLLHQDLQKQLYNMGER